MRLPALGLLLTLAAAPVAAQDAAQVIGIGMGPLSATPAPDTS